MQRRPNFLYLGAPKAGSTWLFNLLRAHPAAFVPPAKELSFFDRQFHRGEAWYLEHFAGAREEHCAIGELSHDYLYSSVAAARIREFDPQMKLVAVLRDPLDRLVSEAGFLARNGENASDLDKLLDRYPELVEKCLYARHVGAYDRLFPSAYIKVMLYDDLKAAPLGFANELFDFLGLPMLDPFPEISEKNAAASPRARWLALGAKRLALILRAVGGAQIVGRVKSAKIVKNALYRPVAPDLSLCRRQAAHRFGDLFLEDIALLERRLQRPLSRWRANIGANCEPHVVIDEPEEQGGRNENLAHAPELRAEAVD